MRARSEEIVLETRLDHPPANEALETDQTGDTEEVDGHPGGDSAARDKVQRGKDKRHANEATPEAMGPFHEVNLLELLQRHVRVEQLEFRGRTVFFEFRLPVGE